MNDAEAAYARLNRELGARAPDSFAALDAARLGELVELLHAARERQRRQMDAALSRALEHVPALMRGPVRRILGL